MTKPTSVTQKKSTCPSWPINWVNTFFLVITGLIALIGMPLYLYFMGISWPLVGVFVFYLAATGFSITGGYHRLFAHRAYDVSRPVKLFFLLFGAAACENSVLKWAADHREHHRFVDQEADPYNIQRGFFFAHMGWIFIQRPANISPDNVGDLLQNPLVRWQHRSYVPIAILVGGVLPLVVGYFLGDAWGCFLLAGVTRTVIIHHSTFLINSLCHYMGNQPYSLKDSSRDSALVALLTLGEGYHNFHHRFQYDFRNGVRWYHFDPTKWLIKTLEIFRLAKDLQRAPEVHIFKARLDMQRGRVEERLSGLSQEFRAAMEQKITATHVALLTAYSRWRNLKTEYRSVRETVDNKRQKLILELRHDLQRARSHFLTTQASWALIVQRSIQVPA